MRGASSIRLGRKTGARRARPGLSLIETLIALAIFVVAGAMLMESCANALRSLDAVKERDNREQLFRFAIRQIILIADRDEFESGGDIKTVDEQEVTWSSSIEETNIVDLFKVELTLAHSEEKSFGSTLEEEGRVETLYLLRPDWSDPGDREALLEEKTEALESARSGL